MSLEVTKEEISKRKKLKIVQGERNKVMEIALDAEPGILSVEIEGRGGEVFVEAPKTTRDGAREEGYRRATKRGL